MALKRLSAQCRREQRRRTEQIESLGLSFEQVGRSTELRDACREVTRPPDLARRRGPRRDSGSSRQGPSAASKGRETREWHPLVGGTRGILGRQSALANRRSEPAGEDRNRMIGGVLRIVAADPDDCKHKVYDLGTDPVETTDHSPDRPYRTVSLRAAAKAWCAINAGESRRQGPLGLRLRPAGIATQPVDDSHRVCAAHRPRLRELIRRPGIRASKACRSSFQRNSFGGCR